ncbi:MAG TPA: YCF48-related protein [Bryobacteraceae bacterium]|nr:YCF48-related protein [Bryobacteraceae bacterium]
MFTRDHFAKLFLSIGMLALPVVASAAGDICYLRDAAAPSVNSMYLLCGQAIVYSTADAGGHWTMNRMVKAADVRASSTMTADQRAQLILGATPELHAISFSDDSHGIVVGNSGTIFTTADAGKTWTQRQDAKKQNYTTEHLVAVFAVGNQAWASGFYGTMLHSSDGGATWEKQVTGTTMDLQGLYFINQDLGWAVGWSGTILRTADGGKNWKIIASDSATWSLNTVFFKDEKNGWACGFAGELLGSTDGGLTWKTLKSPIQNGLSSIKLDKSGRLWIAADDSLLLSEDGGATWSAVSVGEHANVFMIKVFGKDNSLWALGELGLMHEAGTSKEWKPVDNFHPAGTYIADSLEEMSDQATPASPNAPAAR